MARDPRSAFTRFLDGNLDALLAPGETSDGLPEALALLRRAADGVPAYGAMLKRLSYHQKPLPCCTIW